MTFKERSEDCKHDEWGCPRWFTYGASGYWLIDFYRESGALVGARMATPEEISWILANPDEVAAMQAKVLEWLGNGSIPY